MVILDGSFTNGEGSHTASVDWGDGSPVESALVDPDNKTVSASHAFEDDGVFTVTMTVTNSEDSTGSDTFTVTVENAAPILDAGPNQSAESGESIDVLATFTDPGILDTHTATIDWGDESPIGPGILGPITFSTNLERHFFRSL